MNTMNNLTNFKVIVFGNQMLSNDLETLSYDGVAVINASGSDKISPTDDDKMAIIVVAGDEEAAKKCANTFYQAGVLTVAITQEGITLPADCCDAQTQVDIAQFVSNVKALLDIVFIPGFINLDFNDLLTCLKNSGQFRVATLRGLGDLRIANALSQLKDISPKIDTNLVTDIIIALYYNRDSKHPIEISETSAITKFIASLPSDVNAIFGLYHDDTIVDDSIRVDLILTLR